jgi:hypothetical protein
VLPIAAKRTYELAVAAGQHRSDVRSRQARAFTSPGIEGQDDLLTWAEVAVSDDHQHWRVVHERADLSIAAGRTEKRTTISYPEASPAICGCDFDGSRPHDRRGDA